MINRLLHPFALACALVLTALASPIRAAADDADRPQYYEIRIYSTKSADQQQRIIDYWQTAAVPAYNRIGIQPIGVFTEITNTATNSIYVLIPCDSLEIFAGIPAKLAADPAYQTAAAGFLTAPKENPAYERYESSLTVAFDAMKHLTVPPADKKPTVFELRTYLSPNDERGFNKVKMFEAGEIQVMKDIGLAPIFYSRKLIGPNQPCMMYMTCGTDMAEHKKHWKIFGQSPVWKSLQADPRYKDNVSKVIRIMLQRTSASQL